MMMDDDDNDNDNDNNVMYRRRDINSSPNSMDSSMV
jgi:hypothetical protein